MPLTDTKIRNLKPKPKPYKVADFYGLYVFVRTSGSRSWRFKYRIDDVEKLLVIGDYPAITLAEARQARDLARSDLAKGRDPSEVKKTKALLEGQAKAQTFDSVAARNVEKITTEGRAQATLVKYEWILGMISPVIGRKPMAEITAPMVLKCLRNVEDKGNYQTARRMRYTIGSIFRFAVATGIAQHDPTFALKGALIQHCLTSAPMEQFSLIA